MEFVQTAIPEVILIKPKVFGDDRGFFMETWEANKFGAAGLTLPFVQDNHSLSQQHTLRGLHYQVHQPQGKLIRVATGQVYDVAVDLRRSSPSFGQWVGVILSSDNKHQLWVPPGYGHGFLAMSERVELIYKCTDFYAPKYERAVMWDDPDLDIPWPLPKGQLPLLSAKDKLGCRLRDAEVYE